MVGFGRNLRSIFILIFMIIIQFISVCTFFSFFSEIEILIRFKIFGDMRDIWQEVDEAVSSFHPTKNSLKVCCLS